MTNMAEVVAGSHGVTGGPRLLLRLEGLGLFLAAAAGYATTEQPWWLFAALFLAPDLSMAFYVFGRRVGALFYNAAHITVLPMVAVLAGFVAEDLTVIAAAMIWLAHIGIDRALGYGLKYSAGFGFTHLGRLGRSAG